MKPLSGIQGNVIKRNHKRITLDIKLDALKRPDVGVGGEALLSKHQGMQHLQLEQ